MQTTSPLASKFPTLTEESGFSFFGVLMIVFALSLMTASFFFSPTPVRSTRQVETTMSRGATLVKALIRYKANHAGTAPASLDNLVTSTGAACAMDVDPASPTYRTFQGWCGPYIDIMISQDANSYKTDGWNVVYQYSATSLRSCGPDKVCGNTDDIPFTGF